MLSLIIQSMRPRQWVKNLVVAAALLFSENLFVPLLFFRVLAAVALFCAVSGAVYLLNDILDRSQDAHHQLKRTRPVASGALPVPHAAVAYVVLVLVSIGAGLMLELNFGLALAAYCLLQALYSVWLKHVVILDLFVIAFGFVIRAVAGALVIQVAISNWLLVCTILLSLFLALCKRRVEVVRLEADAVIHRRVLSLYGLGFLDQMISIVGAATVLSYALYTLADQTVAKFGSTDLMYSIPCVLYGIFRYLYLVHQENRGDEPERVLFGDPPLLISILLFAMVAAWIVY